MRSLALIPAFFMLLAFSCSAQKKVAAKDAAKYSGKTVMICDKVYNTEVVAGSNTTLLYLGSENGEYLTVLVKGPENAKFKWHPEADFKGRAVCVTGKVVDYKNKAAIYVTEPSQIKLDLVDNRLTMPMPVKQ
jgi:DNA/RNA endonuclease YhcR with UshA esterase domain